MGVCAHQSIKSATVARKRERFRFSKNANVDIYLEKRKGTLKEQCVNVVSMRMKKKKVIEYSSHTNAQEFAIICVSTEITRKKKKLSMEKST